MLHYKWAHLCAIICIGEYTLDYIMIYFFVQAIVVSALVTVSFKVHGYSEREQKEIGALNVCKRLHRRDCLARTIHWFS